MARVRLWLHPAAIIEAADAARWYRQRNEEAAEAFLTALESAIDHIAEAPLQYPLYSAGTRRCRLRRFPFSIIYRLTGNEIQVLAVAHTRRRPAYWTDR